MRKYAIQLATMVAGLLPVVATAGEVDMKQALAAAYKNNPQLETARARQRANDENVSQAHGRFRPNVRARGHAALTTTRTSINNRDGDVGPSPAATTPGHRDANERVGTIEVEQPLFRGMRLVNRLREAESGVRAGQAELLRTEQMVLFTTAAAYINLTRDRRVFAFREDAVNMFGRYLGTIQRRFNENDLTKTDLGQAQTRLARAKADRALAMGEMHASEANFENSTGFRPGKLKAPWIPAKLLPQTLEQLFALAENENPAVVQALYAEQAGRHAVDAVRGELYPELSLIASFTKDSDRGDHYDDRTRSGLVGAYLAIPLYEGGVVHSRVRQAKQDHVAMIQTVQTIRNLARESAHVAWARYQAAKQRHFELRSRVESLKEILKGLQREEALGQRSVYDVLVATDMLIEGQILVETAERDMVVNAYGMLQASGRLTAAHLGIADVIYDPSVHYNEVRRKPWGTTIVHDERLSAAEPPAQVKPVSK